MVDNFEIAGKNIVGQSTTIPLLTFSHGINELHLQFFFSKFIETLPI
jgi:hypothetical protein